MKFLPPPEQRTRTDLLVAGCILLAVIVIVAGTWLTSQQHKVDHQVAERPLPDAKSVTAAGSQVTALPDELHTSWTGTDESSRLIAADGGVVSVQGTRVSMLDASSGKEVWHYDQHRQICGLSQPEKWSTLVVTFRGPKGCGEAISFDIATGQYAYTRDALAAEDVETLQGNNRAGTLSPQRVELWRSDLVRTVEVGQQEAPHQPDQQSHTECRFTSALTHDDLLVTAQNCGDPNKKLIRFLKATPEESDAPETIHEFTVPAGAELIGVSGDQAAIYIPASEQDGSRIQILDESGTFHTIPTPEAKGFPEEASVGVEKDLHQPRTYTQGLLHTWFDGQRLTIFNLNNLNTFQHVESAIGTGVLNEGSLLVPVPEGIAEVDPASGKTQRTIRVDRGGYTGEVTLRVSHGQIVEQRGTQLVGLIG